jgi:hypothetical protein
VTELRHLVWLAPEVKRWVRKRVEVHAEGRLRDSYVEELVAFRPAP